MFFNRIMSLIFAALLPLGGFASVFSLEGPSWDNWVPLDGLGWEKGYEAEMVVNDRRTMLHFYSTRYTEPVLSQLQNRFDTVGADFTYSTTEDGFVGVAESDNLSVRVVVSSPDDQPRYFIFMSYADPKEKKVLKEPIPLYPGCSTLSSMANMKTKTHMMTLKTMASMEEVYAFYENILSDQGWVRMTPSVSGPHAFAGGMAVFKKKKKVCYMRVRHHTDLSSIITVLVKNGAM